MRGLTNTAPSGLGGCDPSKLNNVSAARGAALPEHEIWIVLYAGFFQEQEKLLLEIPPFYDALPGYECTASLPPLVTGLR